MTTTPTTETTTDQVSKSIGQSLASRAIKPALGVLAASSGLGIIGTVGAGVASDVVSPLVKKGITNGKIKPIGAAVGGLLGYYLSKDSQTCKTSPGGSKTNCKPNYVLRGGAILATALLGNWIDGKIRNFSAPLTTTETTTPTTTNNVKTKTDPMEGINIDQLMKMVFTTYNMKGNFWGLVLGESVSDPFATIIYGSPGGGKTTMALKFADYFGRNHGKVKFISSEMGISDGLKSIVKRTKMTSKKVYFDATKKPVDDLIKELKENNFKMLIIDSANFIGYTPEDIEKIKDSVKGLSTFIILQSTKDGNFRGANDYAHNADIVLKVHDLEVYTEKTRFAAKNLAGMPINS